MFRLFIRLKKYIFILQSENMQLYDIAFFVCIRYMELTKLSVRAELLQLINLDAADCSAPKIFDAFEKALSAKTIPLFNICGLACDNASGMVGNRSSFKTKLQEKSPRLIIFQCVSYSSAIVAKYACAKIPDVEDIIKRLAKFPQC